MSAPLPRSGDVLYAAPAVYAPARVRTGVALFRDAMLLGECPLCGAPLVPGSDRAEPPRTASVQHQPGCPGGDRRLTGVIAARELARAASGGDR